MTLLQYYLFANAYLLVFWFFYVSFLKKRTHFQASRIYLIAAPFLALLLPLLQSGISSLLSSGAVLDSNVQDLPVLGFIYHYQESLTTSEVSVLNWKNIFVVILLLGSFSTAIVYLVHHFRIISILRRSDEQILPEMDLRVRKSAEVNVPFIYRDIIVLPDSISYTEIPMVLQHEAAHYRYRHHWDNFLYCLGHLFFWLNPLYLLLRASLKLNHEYQVDGQMLSSGTDPIFYKLSLIKYSVGPQKFSLANGLSSSKIKSRLQMINSMGLRRGKRRLFLLIPILILPLTFFCLACVEKDVEAVHEDIPITDSPAEPVTMKIIGVTDDNLQDIKAGEVIVVLMNRNSKLMVAGEKNLPLERVEEKIISEYQQLAVNSTNIKVVLQKDVQADSLEYQKLLEHISMSLIKLRNIESNKIFGSDFALLNEPEKKQVTMLVPYHIYRQPNKYMRPRAPKAAR